MDLKEKLLSSFMAFEERVDDVQTELHEVRTSAINNFENKGFPTKKDEAWKYTSLSAILKNDFSVFPKNETTIEFSAVKKYFLHEIDTYKVVFVDGIFSSHLSSTTHDGIDVCLMSSALNKHKYKMVIDNYFNQKCRFASCREIHNLNRFVCDFTFRDVDVRSFIGESRIQRS